MVTLLISDIHLGSELSQAERLLARLQREWEREPFDLLILVGDIFASLNLGRLKRAHFQLLNYLRWLSNPKRGVKVVWIEGNHDAGLIDVMSHLVGVEAFEEYTWEQNGETCLAIHGHQFDAFILKQGLLAACFSFLFRIAQRWSLLRRSICIHLDALATKWCRLTPEVAARAIRYARTRGARYVFCGHTHEPHHEAADGIDYFNTGAWVGTVCSYIRMTETGIEQIVL